MVKNRRITYCKGPERKKIRSNNTTNSNINEKEVSSPDRSLLNTGLLSLYRKELELTVGASKLASTSIQSSSTELSDTKSNNSIEDGNKLETPKVGNLNSLSKTPRKRKKIVSSLKNPTVTVHDIGGLNKEISCILEMCLHLKYPEESETDGRKEQDTVRGILLHGPPGCGKTLLANAIAGFLKIPLLEVVISSLLHGTSGDSYLHEFFNEALLTAPCILFIDHIDAISGKRDVPGRGVEKSMVNELAKCFDELNAKDPTCKVIIIGSTNSVDVIDSTLRIGGRFDQEIALTMPNEDGRLKILQILCKDLQLSNDCDINLLAHITPGFSGSDLKNVAIQAKKHARRRYFRKLHAEKYKDCDGYQDRSVDSDSPTAEEVISWFESDFKREEKSILEFVQQDFEKAIRSVVPCAKREGYPTVPNVTWNDVGALKEARDIIERTILWPVKLFKKALESYGRQSTTGILLCGPKGCGKTLLAKAIANEAGINFLSVRGPELLNMYLGESEKSVRQTFFRARTVAPCIIFFDEIDALCSSRSSSNVNAASDRVVTQLLTEMEGVEDRKQVFVIAATNRPEKLDSAMLRPGRLSKIIFVDLPTAVERVDILKSITGDKKKWPKFAENVDFEAIGLDPRCNGFSGADLSELMNEALSFALVEAFESNQTNSVEIKLEHIEKAFTAVEPSVSEQEREELKENFSRLKK